MLCCGPPQMVMLGVPCTLKALVLTEDLSDRAPTSGIGAVASSTPQVAEGSHVFGRASAEQADEKSLDMIDDVDSDKGWQPAIEEAGVLPQSRSKESSHLTSFPGY